MACFYGLVGGDFIFGERVEMENNLLIELYKQILFFSENAKTIIDHPGLMIHETCKCSGQSRTAVNNLFYELNNIGFLEKVPEEQYAYRIKEMMSIEKIKERIL